jgi:hypothetical protein
MDLPSGMSKRFNQPFLCDEDTLRRTQATLEKHAKELSKRSTTVVFHVEREDDRYYETTRIEEVLAEPNVSGKRICLLSIELRPSRSNANSGEDWLAILLFSFAQPETLHGKDFVILRFVSSNKNGALLLSDELEAVVQQTRKVSSTPPWLLSLFMLPYILVGMKVSTLFASIYARVAFLFFILGSLLLIGYAAVESISRYGFPTWFKRAFGPESAFLWGSEAHAYPEREKTRRKIFWGVGIAFLLCLIISFIFIVLVTPSILS